MKKTYVVSNVINILLLGDAYDIFDLDANFNLLTQIPAPLKSNRYIHKGTYKI